VHEGATGGVPGCGAGVVTDDHAPQLGCASVLGRQAIDTTTVPPFAPAPVQTAFGSCSVFPANVQSVPFSNTTQQALAPQTPLPPAGNCSATLTVAGSVSAGSVIVQLAGSTTAATAPVKHAGTSKQPAPAPASVAVPLSLPPSAPGTLPGV
jgi:hypothetical protein